MGVGVFAVQKYGRQGIMTVNEDVRFNGHPLADDPFGRKAATVYLWFDVLDDDARATFIGLGRAWFAFRFDSHLRGNGSDF